MTSQCLWCFKLISGYILSLHQGFCVYRSRPKTDRSVRSDSISEIIGPMHWAGPRTGPDRGCPSLEVAEKTLTKKLGQCVHFQFLIKKMKIKIKVNSKIDV